MLRSAVSHLTVFVLGAIFGAFVLKRNPLKGARTLDELELFYRDARARLLAKLRR